jgi:hypothetical protein
MNQFDKLAAVLFFGFFGLMTVFVVVNALNAWLRESRGWKCLWCKQHFVGRRCGCHAKPNRVGAAKTTDVNSKWHGLDLDERLYKMARYYQKNLLKARREHAHVAERWFYEGKRDSMLQALREYKECRKRGVYR